MNHNTYDLVIIGAGILGTFHAYHALKKGLTVALIEKNVKPQGATVRNFGQVVPSGMNLKWQIIGRKSLEIYKEINKQIDITIRQTGSIYLASNPEEVQLIEELADINITNGYKSYLLTTNQCIDKCPGLNPNYAKAGLFFPEEMNVDPSIMIHKIHTLLVKKYGLHFFSNKTIINIEEKAKTAVAFASNGDAFSASKIIICNGSDFKALYPEVFKNSNLEVTKLQMLRTKPQKNYILAPSVLTGWTIRRYEAFTECPSFKAIKAKENKTDFQNKYGIHILFKQVNNGGIILGDSHEYQDAKNADLLGFNRKEEIDNFIISESKKIINLPSYTIDSRWVGQYSQCKNSAIFEYQINKNTHIVTGIGGKGMTGSPGFSELSLNAILNK